MSLPFRRPGPAAGDPIPFSHNGETHLFYLSSPDGTAEYPDRVRTSWRHQVSTDLVAWKELPTALTPGAEYDADGVWTGSVVEHGGTFHLFYTGHRLGAANPQTICLATSTDLVTFERHPANPLVLPVAGCEPVDWRDPYVFFNADEGVWWMLIAARLAEGTHHRRGCVMLATSPDLLTWTVEPDPLYAPDDTFCPECPELWAADGRWHLVYSRFSERAGTIQRVADAPRGPFRVPPRDELGGRRWYAAKSAPVDGGRAFFGWVHDRVGARWAWGGDFALPRLATARPDGSLAVAPAPGVLDHWTRPVASATLALRGVGGTARERVADLPDSALTTAEFATGDAAAVGLELAAPTGARWRVDVDLRARVVALHQEPHPLDDFWADLTGEPTVSREVDGPVLASAPLLGTGPVRLSVLLDDGVLEIYAGDEVALTHRVPREDYTLWAYAVDGDADVTVAVTGRGGGQV